MRMPAKGVASCMHPRVVDPRGSTCPVRSTCPDSAMPGRKGASPDAGHAIALLRVFGRPSAKVLRFFRLLARVEAHPLVHTLGQPIYPTLRRSNIFCGYCGYFLKGYEKGHVQPSTCPHPWQPLHDGFLFESPCGSRQAMADPKALKPWTAFCQGTDRLFSDAFRCAPIAFPCHLQKGATF